jgi:hypothetical protein
MTSPSGSPGASPSRKSVNGSHTSFVIFVLKHRFHKKDTKITKQKHLAKPKLLLSRCDHSRSPDKHDDQPKRLGRSLALPEIRQSITHILRALRDLRVETQIAQNATKINKENKFGRAKLLLSRYDHSR